MWISIFGIANISVNKFSFQQFLTIGVKHLCTFFFFGGAWLFVNDMLIFHFHILPLRFFGDVEPPS